MTQHKDPLTDMLHDGWVVAGYANTLMAAGAMNYSVLLQRGGELVAVTVGISNQKEIGRTVVRLAPAPSPAAKTGWF